MLIRMRLLLIVDRIRTWLLQSLSDGPLEQEQPEERPFDLLDPDSYHPCDEQDLVLVDRTVLAPLVVAAAIQHWSHVKNLTDEELEAAAFMTVEVVNHSSGELMYANYIDPFEFAELARDAEVDHLLDFLANKEWKHALD